jgi:periplasmic protein TonB
MLPKKSHKANLERRKAIHIQVGLIIALSFVLVSLEWGTLEATTEAGVYLISSTDIETDIPMRTVREKPKELPKTPKLMIPTPVDEGDEDKDIDYSDMFDSEEYGYEIDWNNYIDEDEAPVPEAIDYILVQFKPEFPGGNDVMMKWLYSNINYPDECVEHGIEGRVTARFTISKFGEVIDIKILRGVHPLMDAEVVRVLNLMPNFRPAMQGTQLIPVFMSMPVVFDLR